MKKKTEEVTEINSCNNCNYEDNWTIHEPCCYCKNKSEWTWKRTEKWGEQ